jgi:S1-C subfamily serine protease
MKKALLGLVGFMSVIAAAASVPASAWDIDRMNEQIEKTNVIVGGVCSGTFIAVSERLVLSAHHCITDQVKTEEVEEVDPKTGEIRKKTIQKRIPLSISVRKVQDYEVVGITEHLVKIVGIDAKNDIALLQVVDTEFKPLAAAPLASDSYSYKRGLTVYAVGNPGIEFDNSITQGIISAPERTVSFGPGSEFKMFQHSATTIGGNSGGSILNDNGELIGTVTGGLRGAAISFAVPIKFTKALLRSSGFAKVLERK